jgi:hypothetical protein
MALLSKIRWLVIRRLLRKSEQLYLYEACELHCDRDCRLAVTDKLYEWHVEEAHFMFELKRKIAGDTNFTKWS